MRSAEFGQRYRLLRQRRKLVISIGEWRHVFKLDQAREIDDESLEKICESGTDAVIVGGTTEITFDNTVDLLARIRRYALPCVLEVSHLDAVVPGFDLYLIPVVLNAGTTEWIFDPHVAGLKEHGPFVPWNEVMVEGYVILNEDSSAAKVTRSRTGLDLQDVKAYARLADKLLKLPILYLEYSGAYGKPEWIREIKGVVNESRIFYGGGISSKEKAAEMAKWADTIVVGNIIYENLDRALETVEAVKSVQP